MLPSQLKTVSLAIALLGSITVGVRLPAQQLAATPQTGFIAGTFSPDVTRGEYRAFNTGGEPGRLGIVIALGICLSLSLRRASRRQQDRKAATLVANVPYTAESPRIVPISETPRAEAPRSFV